MIPIHFQANFQPNRRKFLVSVTMKGRKFVERMSIAKFIRFARATDKPIMVDGMTIKFESDVENAEKTVRDYFKAVADAYMQFSWGKPRNN